MVKERAHLDQYYTSKEFIKYAVQIVQRKIKNYNDLCWIDFSAGYNDFLKTLRPKTKYAFDLEPKDKSVKQKDWFDVTLNDVKCKNKQFAVGFNPPYGKFGSLSKRFVKHALKIFDPQYFVLLSPKVSWSFLYSKYRTIYKEKTGANTFYTLNGKPFSFSVPFIILQRRQTQKFEQKCLQKYVLKIRSGNGAFFDSVNFIIHRYGDGSVARHIFVKQKDNEWFYFHDGKLVKKMRSFNSVHFSFNSFHYVELSNKVNRNQLAKQFLNYFQRNIACESTPCNMSQNLLCKTIKRFCAQNC